MYMVAIISIVGELYFLFKCNLKFISFGKIPFCDKICSDVNMNNVNYIKINIVSMNPCEKS